MPRLAALLHSQSGPGILTTRAEFYCTKTWNYSTVNFQANTPVKSKLLIIIYHWMVRHSERRTGSFLTSQYDPIFGNFVYICSRTKKWFILSHGRFWVKLNENPRWWALKLQRNFFWCWLDKFYSKGGELHHILENKCFSMLFMIYSKKSNINIFTKTFIRRSVVFSFYFSFSDLG